MTLRQVLRTCEQAIEEKLKQKVGLVVELSADPSIYYVRASLPSNPPTLTRDERVAVDVVGAASITGAVGATAQGREMPGVRFATQRGRIREGEQQSCDQSGDGISCSGGGIGTNQAGRMNEDGISSGGIVRHEDCRGEGGGKGGGLTPPKLAEALQSQQPLMRLITQDHNWQPAVDLHHGHAEFLIIIDLPGLKIPDIKVSRTGARLLLRGSRRIPCAPQIRAGLPLPATVPYHLLQLSSQILLF